LRLREHLRLRLRFRLGRKKQVEGTPKVEVKE